MLWKSASSALEASDADVMASMPEMGNAGKRQLGVEQGLVGWSDLLCSDCPCTFWLLDFCIPIAVINMDEMGLSFRRLID